MFSGRFVDAKEALALGLLDEMVAPDAVYDAAVDWAQRFVDVPAQALAAAKAAITTAPPRVSGGSTSTRSAQRTERFVASDSGR